MSSLIDNLRSHLINLAYPRHALKHPTEHEKASLYVKKTLADYGYTVEADPVPFEGKTYSNWIGTLPEDRPDLPLLIIGAHFDSVPDSPGADDNASGVAVMLEAARLYREQRLMDKGPQTISVQFVGFDLEECITVGSIAYAQRLKHENRKVFGMMSLEMLGSFSSNSRSQQYPMGLSPFYPDRGDFIALVGSSCSLKLVYKLRKAFKKTAGLKTQTLLVPGTGRLIPAVRRSDHAPFWDLGYPAVMVTDTSFFRNPYYHTPQDTVEKLDLPFMALITQAITSFLISSF